MTRPIVKIRSDGLVLIRPRRATDSAVLRDLAALFALLVSFSLFSVVFAVAVVEAPHVVAAVGGCLVAGIWGARRARSEELQPVPIGEPPPRRIA